MKLEMASFIIKRARFHNESKIENGELFINKEELEGLLSRDQNLKQVAIHLALPGEKVRVVNILDIVEPRIKVRGEGCAFPGFLGPPRTVGEGRTHCLAGVALVETGKFPYQGRGVLIVREQVIDMSGPVADYSPFSRTINVVLEFRPADGVSAEEYDASTRLATLKAATYLAQLSANLQPDDMSIWELREVDRSLPRIAYVYQVRSIGSPLNCYLYGQDLWGLPGTLLHPNELMDGALVGGKGSMGIETYVHCNNPVVSELYQLHGEALNFVGIVLTAGGESKGSSFSKERGAYHVAKLLKLLKAEGVVLTQEGGGNSIMDQMLICRACEEAGIKAVLLTYEMGGTEGIDAPLIYAVPEADAIVSLGNREEKVILPPMERVLGGETALFDTVRAKDSFDIHLSHVKAAVNQAGFGHLRGWGY